MAFTEQAEAYFDCAECGDRAFLTEAGIAHHEDEDSPTGIDHRADGDHTAYPDPAEDEALPFVHAFA